MSLIVTPSQLAHRSQFYQQLGSLMSAGVNILQALEMIGRNPPASSFRKPMTQVAEKVAAGATLAESMAGLGAWIPVFDLALIDAAEQSGRMPDAFRLLASYYNDRSQLARQILMDLLYPLFIVHFAIAIFPTSQLVEMVRGLLGGAFNPLPYLRAKLMMLLPAYAIIFLFLVAGQSQRGEFWRGIVERFLGFIPLIGSARRSLALARLSAALEALIGAGVWIVPGWNLAAAASGSPALKREVSRWRGRLEAGETPAELLNQNSQFPELFANLYHTGEVSGQLDDTLRRLHVHYQEEGSRKLRLLGQWLPRVIYIAVLIAVAFQIINFWTGYYGGVLDELGP